MRKLSTQESRSMNGGYTYKCRACDYKVADFKTLLWQGPIHVWSKHGVHISDWKKAFG